MALYCCNYAWPEKSGLRAVAERTADFNRLFIQMEGAADRPTWVRGWYLFPGTQAGVLFAEAESAEQLHSFLLPYTELMTFDVRPVLSIDYARVRENLIPAE